VDEAELDGVGADGGKRQVFVNVPGRVAQRCPYREKSRQAKGFEHPTRGAGCRRSLLGKAQRGAGGRLSGGWTAHG